MKQIQKKSGIKLKKNLLKLLLISWIKKFLHETEIELIILKLKVSVT
jgi:hypothetical protein